MPPPSLFCIDERWQLSPCGVVSREFNKGWSLFDPVKGKGLLKRDETLILRRLHALSCLAAVREAGDTNDAQVAWSWALDAAYILHAGRLNDHLRLLVGKRKQEEQQHPNNQEHMYHAAAGPGAPGRTG